MTKELIEIKNNSKKNYLFPNNYLSSFFLFENKIARFWSLKDLDNRIIASIDEKRKIVFIESENIKILNIFLDKLKRIINLTEYRINFSDELYDYIILNKYNPDQIDLYSILEYKENKIYGLSVPTGKSEIIRDSKGFPIESRIIINNKVIASSSIFWLSSESAELSLECFEYFKYKTSLIYVLANHSSELIKHNITPIYLVSEINFTSRRIAEEVGYRDTGNKIIEISNYK